MKITPLILLLTIILLSLPAGAQPATRSISDTQVQEAATRDLQRRQKLLSELLDIARKDASHDVRESAIGSIANLGREDSIKPLCQIALTDPDVDVRKAALSAVANFHDDASMAGLLEIYDKLDDEQLKLTALLGLAPNGDHPLDKIDPVSKLTEIVLKENTNRLAGLALSILASYPGDEVAAALTGLYDKSSDRTMKLAIIYHLKRHPGPLSDEKLLTIARSDPDAAFRQAAVVLLGNQPFLDLNSFLSTFTTRPAPPPIPEPPALK